MNVGHPSNDASTIVFGMYRIVLSRPYIVGVITNSTSRTDRPTTIDASAAVDVPMRHTSPRMNGTTRQASSKIESEGEQDAGLLDVDRDQRSPAASSAPSRSRVARNSGSRWPGTCTRRTPPRLRTETLEMARIAPLAVLIDAPTSPHSTMIVRTRRARTGPAARTGPGRRVRQAGTPSPTARRDRTGRRSRPTRWRHRSRPCGPSPEIFAANTRCMKSIATMSPMPSAISVAQLMVGALRGIGHLSESRAVPCPRRSRGRA